MTEFPFFFLSFFSLEYLDSKFKFPELSNNGALLKFQIGVHFW